jgi:hypothetical protein
MFLKRSLVATIIATTLSSAAWADLTSDLSFGTGDYNGWTAGPASGTQTGNYSGNGIGAATVTGDKTVSCCGSNTWIVSPYTGSYMVSLQPFGGQNYSTMTSALGLSASSITALNTEINAQGTGSITSGVWITKNFTFSSPATFKMAWNYISTDYVPFSDGSLTSLVNTGAAADKGKINGVTTEYLLLGATNPNTGNYSTGSYGSTGWQWVNYEITTSGTYKVGFSAFNQGDTALSPVLFVNDGLGTTTKNGTAFNPVAPNDPTMPTTNPDGTVSTGGSGTPTVVSTAPGTPIVTSTLTNGDTVVTNSITYGVSAVAVALTNSKGAATPKTLTVTQTTATTSTTPFTLTTTNTTPVTTVTNTTPVTVKTWSDGTTTTENGTATQSTSVANSVTSSSVNGNEIIEVDTNKDYSTKIDQYAYLEKANNRFNQQLDSTVFDRHEVSGDVLRSRSLNMTDGKGYFYITADGQRTNTNSDGYKMSSSRFGLGYEKQIESNWIVGGQINSISSTLTGVDAGGALDKQHVGVYSLYTNNDWVMKTDVGFANNQYKNYHTLPELQLSNTGSATGNDVWFNNRVYAPSTKGFRPFVEARVEKNYRAGTTENGSDVSAMTYDKLNNTKVTGGGGVRYENKVMDDKVNLIAEVGQTGGITTAKAGASFSPKQNVIGGVTIAQQRQDGVTNNTVQAHVKVFF